MREKLAEEAKADAVRVLEKHAGNVSKAAKELGMPRRTLYRRLHAYGLMQ